MGVPTENRSFALLLLFLFLLFPSLFFFTPSLFSLPVRKIFISSDQLDLQQPPSDRRDFSTLLYSPCLPFEKIRRHVLSVPSVVQRPHGSPLGPRFPPAHLVNSLGSFTCACHLPCLCNCGDHSLRPGRISRRKECSSGVLFFEFDHDLEQYSSPMDCPSHQLGQRVGPHCVAAVHGGDFGQEPIFYLGFHQPYNCCYLQLR